MKKVLFLSCFSICTFAFASSGDVKKNEQKATKTIIKKLMKEDQIGPVNAWQVYTPQCGGRTFVVYTFTAQEAIDSVNAFAAQYCGTRAVGVFV